MRTQVRGLNSLEEYGYQIESKLTRGISTNVRKMLTWIAETGCAGGPDPGNDTTFISACSQLKHKTSMHLAGEASARQHYRRRVDKTQTIIV